MSDKPATPEELARELLDVHSDPMLPGDALVVAHAAALIAEYTRRVEQEAYAAGWCAAGGEDNV